MFVYVEMFWNPKNVRSGMLFPVEFGRQPEMEPESALEALRVH